MNEPSRPTFSWRSREMLSGLFMFTALLFLAFAAGFGAHWLLTRASGTASDAPGSVTILTDAQRLLRDNFLGQPPAETTQVYGAIRGLVETYQDPYTVFIEPQPRAREKDQLRGRFGGIGAYVAVSTTGQVFLTPMPGRPAEKAGIQANDELLAVDGKSVSGKNRDEVVDMVRGEVGTQTTLRIGRVGADQPFDLVVTREEIENPSVEWRLLENDPRTGYVALHIFGERSVQELKDAINDLRGQGAQRLILDLRHNPGGLLETAVDVASQFLASGRVLNERHADSETTYDVRGAGVARDLPLVVLTDEGTASAAEIVAGALQDAKRAPIIGAKTFGKGSVQLVFDLRDGSSLHVTTARWFTPAYQQIDGKGLTPDVPVVTGDAAAGGDPVLDAALAWFDKP
ncbi:MAG: S41 family peptidase [Anaerolineae bacterium]|nr:S41 family peptidase [Anaerolineae bacterium]